MRRVIRTKHLACVGDVGDDEYDVFLRLCTGQLQYLGTLFDMPSDTPIFIMREWDDIGAIVFEEETKRIKA